MNATTFNNAFVSTVGAYAEALSEQLQLNAQLHQALQSAQAAKIRAPMSPGLSTVLEAARAVAKHKNLDQATLLRRVDDLEAALQAFDSGRTRDVEG